MPKKRGKGAARKRNRAEAARDVEIPFAEDGQAYAFVRENLGGGRFRVMCGDGADRIGVLRGSMRKRQWVRRGDIVLVGLRDFQDAKADVVHKYSSADVTRLASLKEISDALMRHYAATDGQDAEQDALNLEHFAFAECEDLALI